MKLWQKSAVELAKMFKKGEVSSTEIVEAHLKRVDDINPGLNAICTRIDDQTLAAAKAADVARTNGEPLGLIAGVPFTIKSNIDIQGSATDNGIPALKDSIPPIDAPVTARMKAAGGIPLGRTNLPDLGLRSQTESTLHGLTLNPWNKKVTTGGSSGGEAVALATGMSPLAWAMI